MKPTQQEIIEVARAVDIVPGIGDVVNGKYRPHKNALGKSVPVEWLQEFAKLLLKRFGAGGGEPCRDMPHGWVTNWPAPNGGTRPVYHASAIKPKYGPELDNSLVSYPVFTRPGSSPTDLRAEYLRGLDDAAKVCRERKSYFRKLSDLRFFENESCAVAIEALKGKQ